MGYASEKTMSVNYNIVNGQTLEITLTLFQSIAGVKTPFDLTGFDAKSQTRQTLDGAVIAEASISNGRIVISGADNNVLTITLITNVESAALTCSTLIYDVLITSPTNEVTLIQSGQIFHKDSVTQL